MGLLSPHLLRVLVIITFHWNLQKTAYLYIALKNSYSYRTDVDVIVVTDHAEGLRNVLQTWGLGRVVVRQSKQHWVMNSPEPKTDEERYSLTWEYHSVVAECFHKGKYTAFIYLEDDTLLSWSAVVSWAQDTEVLAPFNLTRGIYRTEIRPLDGQLVLLDLLAPINVSDHRFKLDVAERNPSLFEEVSKRYDQSTCGGLENSRGRSCNVHRHYLQLSFPFQGMWMATRSQLESYLQNPLWQKSVAVSLQKRPELFHGNNDAFVIASGLGHPERSNAMTLFMNVPSGFQTNNVVPYLQHRGAVRLSLLARVDHMRNGYSTIPHAHGRLLWKDALCMNDNCWKPEEQKEETRRERGG